MLLATPALDAAQLLGVEVQREGASDPSQHGRTAPLLLPKKELGRFLQRIKDAEKLNRERAAALLAKEASKAARAAAAATEVEEAQAAAAQVEMVPAGTRRACFHAGMSYVRDKAHHAWLLEEASSSDGGSNPRHYS